ncbi:MAG: glycosyltransferase family 9 protein [Hyphomonadaceae bacterium]|nr:glycosyltransferase family 9 protein [Hyphomonadaceae bacterium]
MDQTQQIESDKRSPLAAEMARGQQAEDGLGAQAVLDAMDRPDVRSLRVMLDRFKLMGKTISGYPSARPSDCAAIASKLEFLFEDTIREFETKHVETVERFFDLVSEFESTPVSAYASEALRLVLLKVRALIVMGRAEDALKIIEPWAERPYRVEGHLGHLRQVFELDLSARLILGRLNEVGNFALARVLLLAPMMLLATPGLFNQFHKPLSVTPDPSHRQHWAGIFVRHTAKFLVWSNARRSRSTFDRATKRGLALAARLLGGVLLSVAALTPSARGVFQPTERPNKSPPRLRGSESDQTPTILVTRPMGGLGDIIMMTPGIAALHAIYGRKVAFAIPKKFHEAFDGNPNFELIDSDSLIDLSAYRVWINLGFCPAGKYESQNAPNVRKGRVELFARAMGISKSQLNLYGWSPKCALSPTQEATIKSIRNQAGSLPIIGVQLHSRDTYKDYPRMAELVADLANLGFVVPIHSTAVPLPSHSNIFPCFEMPLSMAVAMVAASDTFVSVDSGFYHFAAAFDIPCVGLFGPTSGVTFSKHHNSATIIETLPRLSCSPCWRNEDERCKLSDTFDSVCMAGISIERVSRAVAETLARHGIRDNRSRAPTSSALQTFSSQTETD